MWLVIVLVANLYDVRVYRRADAREIDLSAEGDIAAPPERVRDVLLDYEHHPSWNRHLVESRVLTRGDHFLDVYQRLDLPVLDDRDYTLHVTWGDDWLRFTTANDRGPPPRRGVVRVALHEGEWKLEALPNGGTRAHYHVRLDLAGSLPSWIARRHAGEDVPELFQSIRRLVTLPMQGEGGPAAHGRPARVR
jgi:hypothetical protein